MRIIRAKVTAKIGCTRWEKRSEWRIELAKEHNGPLPVYSTKKDNTIFSSIFNPFMHSLHSASYKKEFDSWWHGLVVISGLDFWRWSTSNWLTTWWGWDLKFYHKWSVHPAESWNKWATYLPLQISSSFTHLPYIHVIILCTGFLVPTQEPIFQGLLYFLSFLFMIVISVPCIGNFFYHNECNEFVHTGIISYKILPFYIDNLFVLHVHT